MSILKGLKKTIVYSSEDEKIFVENVLAHYSILQKKTASAVLEDLVAKAVLPAHPEVRYICKDLYSYRYGCFIAISKVFERYSSGIMYAAKWQNGLELVNHFHSRLLDTNSCAYPHDKSSESNRRMLEKYYSAVVDILKRNTATDHDEELLVFQSPWKYAQHFLTEMVEEPEQFHPFVLTEIVRDSWDILGNNTCTFRMLSALAYTLAGSSIDTSEDMQNLVDLLNKLSKEWE